MLLIGRVFLHTVCTTWWSNANKILGGLHIKFIFSRIKKRRKPKVKLVTLQLCEVKKSLMEDIASMKKSPHVPLRQIAEERRRGKELRVV
jgi:hypothetical protein